VKSRIQRPETLAAFERIRATRRAIEFIEQTIFTRCFGVSFAIWRMRVRSASAKEPTAGGELDSLFMGQNLAAA
jgi:hypothetical protein